MVVYLHGSGGSLLADGDELRERALGTSLKTLPGRRGRARGLQDRSENLSSCRPGALTLTGRAFKQAVRCNLFVTH